MQPSAELRMTLEEYLTFEAASPEAHEYRNGSVVALAVPTGAHAIVYQTIADVTQYVVIDSRRRSICAFERTSDDRFASSGPLVVLDLPRLGRAPILADDAYRDANVPALDDVIPTT